MVADLRERLIAQNMTIKLTDAAYDKIAKEGTDPPTVPVRCAALFSGCSRTRCPKSFWPVSGGARAIPSCATWPMASSSLATARARFRRGVLAGTLGGDTAPAAPHTGNAVP